MTNELLEEKFKELIYTLGESNFSVITDIAWDTYINNGKVFNGEQLADFRFFINDFLECMSENPPILDIGNSLDLDDLERKLDKVLDKTTVENIEEWLQGKRAAAQYNGSTKMSDGRLIGMIASSQVNELIEQGWEFLLAYGDHKKYCDIQEPCWEVDFTRRKDNGLWDNHERGYGNSPDEAIKNAFDNIKNGIRLGRASINRS